MGRTGKIIKFTLLWTVLFLWCFLFSVGAGLAGTQGPETQINVEDDLEGFEDGFEDQDPFAKATILASKTQGVSATQEAFRIGGFAKLEAEYAYDKSDKNLSKLKPVLFIETEYKMTEHLELKVSGQAFDDLSYDIEKKDSHNGSRLDEDAHGVELKDMYLDGRADRIFSFRIGRQIIAWGDSDYARITDVINPRDLTQPGLIDLEDARLPTTAIRLTAMLDKWSFELVTLHEHPGSKIAGLGTDFDYYTLLRSPLISIRDKHTPDSGITDTGIALKVTHLFNGGDFSLVAANTFDDQPYLFYNGSDNGVMVFTPEYDKMTTLGFSSSLVRGSGLFKVEGAIRQDRKIMQNDFLSQISSGLAPSRVKTTSTKDQILLLAGMEYTGITDLRLSFETQMTRTLGHLDTLNVEEYEYRTYFQATKDLLNETATLDLLWVYMNPGHGNLVRLSGTYDLFDGMSIQAGIAIYASADSRSDLHPYKDRDRIFVRVKYSF